MSEPEEQKKMGFGSGSGMTRGRKPPRWTIAFLRALERTGEARAAALDAGIDHTTAYLRRRTHSDFAREWEEALGRFRAGLDEAREAEIGQMVGRLSDESKKAPPPPFRWSPKLRPRMLGCPPDTLCSSPPANAGEDESAPSPSAATPRLVKAGNGRWSRKAEEAFLAELAASANVRRAAGAAGFSTAALYKRRMKDRHFAAAWDAALETGKTRVQAYLIEAATRTFDPDELPIGEEGPTVSIGEAINIARLKGPGEGSGSGAKKGRGHDPFFDGAEEEAAEFESAFERVVEKLGRLCERSREEQAAKGWRLCEQADTMVPPGWARPEEMRIADGGPRSSARLHCPHCGGGLEVVEGGGDRGAQ